MIKKNTDIPLHTHIVPFEKEPIAYKKILEKVKQKTPKKVRVKLSLTINRQFHRRLKNVGESCNI